LLIGAGPANAHEGAGVAGNSWNTWSASPEIVIGLALLAGIYAAGIRRQGSAAEGFGRWRTVFFFSGLAVIFLAFVSPLDALAARLFFMHQVQHLMLRAIGPMLLALSIPQGALLLGLPRWPRRWIVSPVVTNRAFGKTMSFLTHPVVATLLFIASLWFWQIPKYHELALRDPAAHYLMHVSMLGTGLIFWWRVFDSRPAPKGLRHGYRLMMIWIGVLATILLGSYTTVKSALLYPAYGAGERLWELTPLGDELIGGAIMWIPGSMMFVVAAIIVIHAWGKQETRDHARHLALRPGVVAGATSNRTLLVGLFVFSASVFLVVIFIGVVGMRMGS
jgi:putative membrane protein